MVPEDLLLQGIGDQSQDLLILIQQQHRPQISQSLVCEAGRCQQLQAFYLPKMCPLPKGEEV